MTDGGALSEAFYVAGRWMTTTRKADGVNTHLGPDGWTVDALVDGEMHTRVNEDLADAIKAAVVAASDALSVTTWTMEFRDGSRF